MKLNINKKFYIESNQYEFGVFEKTQVKSGDKAGQEAVPKTLGHFSTLDGALKFLIRRTVKMSNSQDNVQQIIDEVRKIEDEIDKALAPLHLK